MIPLPADKAEAETPWEEAVSARHSVSGGGEEQRSAADEVMRYFAAQSSGEAERRAWAMALRKPVEAALEDLRHHPRRAASLLAPVVESAAKEARHRRNERFMEAVGKWAVCLTRPKLWRWALRAMWEGEPVWNHIQQKAQWYEVPEILLIDNRSGRLLSRAEVPSHQLLSGESSLEEMCSGRSGGALEEATVASIPPDRGMQSEISSRVLMHVGWRCKLAARVRGLPPAGLRSQLQLLSQEAEALLTRPEQPGFSQADAVERLLAGGLVSQLASSRPRGWVLALGGLSLACLLMWTGVKEYRWRHFVAALDNEPGLKVLEHDTSWGRHEISGLRDPLARSPEELARNLGLSPDEIIIRFKSFVSADEPMATLRAGARPQLPAMPVLHRNLETPIVQP